MTPPGDTDHGFDRLSDDELVSLIVAARESGDHDQARLCLSILLNRRLPDLIRRVQIKVPAADAEDVAMEAMVSALRSAFAGTSVGEFVRWLQTITKRRIADYHRSRENRPGLEPLPEDHEDAEQTWGRDAAVSGDFSGRVDLQSVVDQALDELKPAPRMVVELYVMRRDTAAETAKAVNMSMGSELSTPMSEDNVHQIGKRFRDTLREMLENDGEPVRDG